MRPFVFSSGVEYCQPPALNPERCATIPSYNFWISSHPGVLSLKCLTFRNKAKTKTHRAAERNESSNWKWGGA